MNKHTPGPWWAETYDIEKNNKEILIYLGEDDEEGDGAKVFGKNRTANAHAIAALPDLLAAAEAMLDAGITAGDWLRATSEQRKAVTALSNAVNKAKGV